METGSSAGLGGSWWSIGVDAEMGMVTDATRENEEVVVTTLGEMLEH